MQRALRVNAAVFHAELEDMQLNFLLPGGISDTRVLNSGSATLSGVGLEVVTFLGRNLPHASRAVLWGEPRRWGIDLRYEY